MATVIRLTKMGRKKKPFYRMVSYKFTQKTRWWLDKLFGYYNPLVEPALVKYDAQRLEYWKSVGAKMSERVAKLTSK